MNIEARIAQIVAGILTLAMLIGLGYLFAQAFLQESEMRLERLQQHRGYRAESPAAPVNVRPNYGEPSTPRTRVFQDAGRDTTSGMGYDLRKKERGK